REARVAGADQCARGCCAGARVLARAVADRLERAHAATRGRPRPRRAARGARRCQVRASPAPAPARMTRVSAVVPVLNGGRYLDELLAALEREGVDGVLVIDSQSDDDSVAIARRRGARVIEIERAQFQHGATRNMGAAESDGELVCFLTQDATPLPGWLDAYREAFALDDRVGAAF